MLLAMAIGGGLAWYITKPAPIIETAKPAEIQPDGSLIAPRAPDVKAKPKHQTPKGAKVERVGSVTVQGETPKEFFACSGGAKCPPVTIDTSLVRLPDGSKRVIVSSPDGQIDKAVDIPVETAAPQPEPPKWAAGLSVGMYGTPGLWLERDIWRVRLGAEINQTRLERDGPSGTEARVRIGWTF